MKKLQKIVNNIGKVGVGIGIAYLLGYGGYKLFENDFPKKGDIFKSEDYKEYYMKHDFVDVNGDIKPDYVRAFYDINQDGIPDISALYFIRSIRPDKTVGTKKNASIVFVDKDQDHKIDYALMDLDLNKTLETKIKDPKVQERKLKPQTKKKRSFKRI